MARPQNMTREALELEVIVLRSKRQKQKLAFKMLQSAIDRKNNRIRNLELELIGWKTSALTKVS